MSEILESDLTRLPAPRPGGRSARVQAAVHEAVLTVQRDGSELSVPAIAALAGVTPSTIYRRWGSLAQLLSDVALERMRPDAPIADTGSLRGDLETWLDQYIEEMGSTPGRAMLRDLVGGALPGNAAACFAVTCVYIDAALERAAKRGEVVPNTTEIRDRVIAPVIYRILFTPEPLSATQARALLAEVLPA